MLRKFQAYNIEHELFQENEPVLLAVSAGIDSMTMLHLFMQQHTSFAVAHCNYQLRGEQSDKDAEFIRNFCKTNNIEFFEERFQTIDFCKKNNYSIQQGARELRYAFFQLIASKHKYSKIAIGTTFTDKIETYFINLLRGSALKGLKGIQAKRNNIIRPIMFAKRADIIQYGLEHNILYREDASNHSKVYLRNKIRHDLMPTLKEISHSAEDKIEQNMQHLDGYFQFINKHIEQIKRDHLDKQTAKQSYFKKSIVQALQYNTTLLFDVFSEYNFNATQIKNLVQAIDKVGSSFSSSTHNLYVDRTHLIIASKNKDKQQHKITPLTRQITLQNKSLTLTTLTHQNFKLDTFKNSKQYAIFDADKVHFPLTLRAWKPADKMIPLGMQQHKNISDILTDNKVDAFEKTQSNVLEDDKGQIIALLGQRVSNITRITDQTKSILLIEIL